MRALQLACVLAAVLWVGPVGSNPQIASCLRIGSDGRLPCAKLQDWFRSVPGFSGKLDKRHWGKEDLNHGIDTPGNPSAIHRLFDKLQKGKPLTVVTFGSSFVLDSAGCWQTSVQALWDLDIVPNPLLYPLPSRHRLVKWDPSWSEGRCSSSGYIDSLMEEVNGSYPHYRHVLVNNGRGGGNLHMISEASCVSAHTPAQIDMVLLDTVTNIGPVWGAEKLVRTLLRGPGAPLVVLASNSLHCGPPSCPTDELHRQCAFQCLMKDKGSRHSTNCTTLPDPYSQPDYDRWHQQIKPYEGLARHYDIAHLNLHKLVHHIINGPAAAKAGLTKWELLARIYQDAVHLRKKELGTLLMADLVMHWLTSAVDAGVGKQVAAGVQPERQPALPKPMSPEASRIHRTRCYGLAFKHLEGREGLEKKLNTTLGELQVQAWMDLAGQPEQAHTFQQLPELKVVEAQGWELQVYYRGARNVQIKPGWITDRVGARLKFSVDSSFGAELEGREVEVLLLYTVSYDGWGLAQATCASGCTCKPHTINATNTARSSLHRLYAVPVTQHPECVMQLETLPNPGGGSKFKMSSVVVRVAVDTAAVA